MRRSTLLAALILAALGAYILWLDRAGVNDEGAEKVFDVERDAVERIEIRRRGEEPLVISRSGDSFRLSAPIDAPADSTEVDLLLQNLESISFERVVGKASGADLDEFGLADPGIEVRFVAGGKERSLAFGKDAPTTSNQYARRDAADEILVLRSHLSLNFDKGRWDLRDKSIFESFESTDVRRIAIERPAGDLALDRENGLYQMVAPRRARADRYRVTTLAARLRDAEMRDIASESGQLEEGYGLANPARRLRFELEDGRAMTLDVGAEGEGGLYARSSSRSAVFLLGADWIEDLDRPASELESKKLFDFSVFEVTKLRIEKRGSPERVVTREGTEEKTWKESGRDLERSAVEDFLYALNEANASEIVPGSGVEDPDVEVTVWSSEPPVEEKASVKIESGFALVHRAGDEVQIELPEGEWSRIEELLSLEGKTEKVKEQ